MVTAERDTMQDREFKMSWVNICNCIQHEMYPELASIVRSFINSIGHEIEEKKHDEQDSTIGLYDIDAKSENILMEFLKSKRNVPIEERDYLSKLIQRARSFTLIPFNATS